MSVRCVVVVALWVGWAAEAVAEVPSCPGLLVIRGAGVEAVVTGGWAFKYRVEAERRRVCREGEAFQAPLPEDDGYLRTCFADDTCLGALRRTAGSERLLVAFVERAGRTHMVKHALVAAAGVERLVAEDVGSGERGPLSDAVAALLAVPVPVMNEAIAVPYRTPLVDERAPRPVPKDEVVAAPAARQASQPCAELSEAAPVDRFASQPVPFERPWVLSTPLDTTRVTSASHGKVTSAALQMMVARGLALPRFRYVTPCEPPRLESLEANPPRRVEYVFVPTILTWVERPTQTKSGKTNWSFEIESSLDVYRVQAGRLSLIGRVWAEVPEASDSISFAAENVASATSGLGESLMKLKDGTDALMAPPPTTGDAAYDQALRQYGVRLGEKLALELKRLPQFRLDANVLGVEGDEALMALGLTEGVGYSDRFVLVPRGGGPDEYVGFGRVVSVGMGGTGGMDRPSRVEVIGGSTDGELRLVEHPQLGIGIDVTAGVMSYTKNALETGGNLPVMRSDGAPALAIGVGWRLPGLPLADVSVRADIHVGIDVPLIEAPAVPLVVEVGLEKRWSLRRFMPLVGLAFTTAIFRVDADAAYGRFDLGTASATTFGATGYAGFGIALSPSWTFKVRGGFRLTPVRAGPVSIERDDGRVLQLLDVEGNPLLVDFMGPFGMAGLEWVL